MGSHNETGGIRDTQPITRTGWTTPIPGPAEETRR